MSSQKNIKEFESHIKKLQMAFEKSTKNQPSLTKEGKKILEEGKKSLQEMRTIFDNMVKAESKTVDAIDAGKEMLSKALSEENIEVAKKTTRKVAKESENFIKDYPLQTVCGAFIVGVIIGKL